MGAQVTASAILAEMRTLAIPASIQSISTNADNQDIVPMGTIGARKARNLIGLLWELLAIDALALVQAMDLRMKEGISLEQFSESSQMIYQWVRMHSAFLEHDRPLSYDIRMLTLLFEEKTLEDGRLKLSN